MTNMKISINTKAKSISLILIAGLVIFISVHMFISSLYAIQANLFLKDWQNKASTQKEIVFIPTEQAWLNANQASQKAINNAPVKDAFLEEQAAKIYQWKTYAEPFGDSISQSNRALALQGYRSQTKITPLWPAAWLNLVSIKIELSEYDQEFYNAFSMAEQTANQNPEVSSRITILGVQAWKNLDNPTKTKVLKNIITEAGLSKKNSQDLKPLLQAYKMLDISCFYAKAIKANTFELCK
ncbi:hypothetical protein [Thiosulfativibrio zosterae]|uniref:Uncharacterized protein n=1 Tax=Thiosulfativibrio zosterae TaxID=2675053 RepID=A0A6F8PQX7_9GAMM|nr:hypothetical protein [Thiosulfativibrio zosterae]BBP44486.1 hypothetical protein THMIRHAT_22320 [Thiosulfativibrio zosterae]